jgi:ApeA N-terminal domain 1
VRIKEEFKKSGYFWLPSAREKKLPGTLSISDGGNIELEVIGLFDESPNGILNALNGNFDGLERIVGRIESDGYVTLDGCLYRQNNSSSNGMQKSLIHANKVFSGVEYVENESVSFNTFHFSVEGIEEWVDISGIEGIDQTLTYFLPENIALNLNNDMQLLITFFIEVNRRTTEAKVTQKTYFKLVSTEERDLNDFISVASKITTLLCFALDETVSIKHITATSDSLCQDMDDGKSRSVPIKIYYPSNLYSKDEPKIYHNQMLFSYKQIQDDAEKIINKWIDAYDEIAPALNLYFATKTGGQKYLEGKFLALAQGLETYHRRTSDDKLMDEVEFKGFVENIVHQCPEEYKDLLKGKLKYGNEISLAKRIKSIIEPFKDLIGTCKERKKTIRSIVDTRNYLTHYDESLKTLAASDQDLFNLCFKMEALFQLHFLQVLEFTPEEIKSIVNDCRLLRWKLKL